MNFNKHYDQIGEHAFLSASKHHWINYDEDRIDHAYDKWLATQKGTQLHDFAKQCIELKIRLPKTKASLNNYVNDAIGYRMRPEQVLFHSVNAFGTADTIAFRENILRIHDLKTGVSPVSMAQPMIYAAFFCLEYDENPEKINIELRIYQSNEIILHKPSGKEVREIMKKVIAFDKRIEKRKAETED